MKDVGNRWQTALVRECICVREDGNGTERKSLFIHLFSYLNVTVLLQKAFVKEVFCCKLYKQLQNTINQSINQSIIQLICLPLEKPKAI